MNNRLQELIDEIEGLRNHNADTPKFNAWKKEVIRTLIKKYGENTQEVKAFKKLQFFNTQLAILSGEFSNDQKFKNDLEEARLILRNYLRDKETEGNTVKEEKTVNRRDVFIVHGRDEGIKAEVARWLTQLELNPIILHEQANKGKTVIEKFEAHVNVKAAIALFTCDDLGKYKDDENLEERARQNVIFETGFFMGKLSRENTIILYEENLKIPSDLGGYIYIPLDNKKRWHFDLAKELKAIGFDIDMNKLL